MMDNLLSEILCYSPSSNWVERAHFYIQLFEKGNLHKTLFKPGIDPTACIHPDAIVSDCSYVGPNCKVGAYCKVTNGTILTENIRLGFLADVYSSIIMDGSVIAHSSCVSHSIVGPECNLAYGFVTATRHIFDNPIRVFLSESSSYFTESKHHGSVLMHGVRAAVHTSTMPGATVTPESRIYPHMAFHGFGQ